MVGKWTTARVVRVSCAGRTGMMATCRDSETAMLVLRKPYLLYLGDVPSNADAKTAFGLRDWCRDDVLAEFSKQGFEGGGSTPEQLGIYVKAQLQVWRDAVKTAGIVPD